MRKIISIALAVFLLIGAVIIAKYLIDNKKRPKPRVNKIVKTVFTETVENKTVPLVITTNGNLVAKHKIELYAEVQGVLVHSSKEFKAGTSYLKGQPILKINSDEFYANLQAQKSNLFNTITAVLPDIRLDFPDEYEKWQRYLQNFDIHKSINPLPIINTDKERYFISGRNILTGYYDVKNLEARLAKYQIIAPFNGVLTEALVNPGTLIRSGQKLGEFINPSIFEIGVSVKSEFKHLLQIGKKVTLSEINSTKTWTGKVIRINAKVDSPTQTITAFIEVKGNNLKEGQYLKANLQAKEVENAFVVQRKLLIDNTKLYVVKDGVLDLKTVQVIFENNNTVVIKGLKNGTTMLSKPVSGSYPGMPVKILEDNIEN